MIDILTTIYRPQILAVELEIPWNCSTVAPEALHHWYTFVSISYVCFETKFLSKINLCVIQDLKLSQDIQNLLTISKMSINSKILTWVSVSFKFFDSWLRFATDKYLFFSNSASKDLIWEAVKAVRGRFFRSSSDL